MAKVRTGGHNLIFAILLLYLRRQPWSDLIIINVIINTRSCDGQSQFGDRICNISAHLGVSRHRDSVIPPTLLASMEQTPISPWSYASTSDREFSSTYISLRQPWTIPLR